MDYEFSIRMLEKELAHQREMQALMRTHFGAHDQSFTAAISRCERIEGILEKLATAQVVTEQKLSNLSDVIAGQQRNGHQAQQ